MSDAENFFTLRIFKRTGSFGEQAHSENAQVAGLLHAAANKIASGVALDRPEDRQLKCNGGIVVAEFSFGAGMIRGPGAGFDRRDFSAPSAHEVANARRAECGKAPPMAKVQITRLPDRPQPPAHEIKRFECPADGPHRSPASAPPPRTSNDVAAEAVRIAANPPGINGDQQRF